MKKGTKQTNYYLARLAALAFWLLLWQILSMQGRLGLFVASPLKTAQTFLTLIRTQRFWRSILYTTGRIMEGFLPAVVLATIFAAYAHRHAWADILLMPAMRFIRTVPVVSFIILALILFSSKYLTQLISFMMALPVVYMNLLTGIGQTDQALSEMAKMYHVPRLRQLRYLYIPSVMPSFETSTVLALGFAWKSGIAAEVIGMPTGSIGERLQQAKVYLDTPDLFAWTLTLVLLSVISEKIWRWLLHLVKKAALRVG